MAEDMGEKTESPSQRKLGDARERGQLPKSTDFSGAVDLIGAVVIIVFFGGRLLTSSTDMVRRMLAGEVPGSGILATDLDQLLVWTFNHGVLLAAPIILLMFAVCALSQFMQVGWLLTLEPLGLKLERLNPLAGFGRIFSRRSAVKTGISFIKLALIGTVVILVGMNRFAELCSLPVLAMVPAFHFMGRVLLEVASWMLLLMFLIGAADWFYQRWQHSQDLRMTKQEVKDERRSMEGDAETKGRRMRMARNMLMQKMRRDVPQADVIVTNPTHFAVALKYDQEKMAAPKVVAKGADFMAFRIREIAVGAGVPIIEKPALARALYAGVKVGQEVRPEFYEAVAEVLAYVYRLENREAPVQPRPALVSV